MKAQLLAQIDTALQPRPLDFANFNVKVYIPRIFAKPGMPLASHEQYKIMIDKIQNAKGSPVVNIRIEQHPLASDLSIANKENVPDNSSKGSKRKDPALLPGNIKKNANIQRLQEVWKCTGKQVTCLGTYCFTYDDGTHLPLSHEHLECWGSAMVSFLCSLSSVTDILDSSRVKTMLPSTSHPITSSLIPQHPK